MVPQDAFWKIVRSDLLPTCLLTRTGSLVKIAVSWPRRPPGQISLFLGSGWEVPFQYTVLTTNNHFWAWVALRPDFPISGPWLGCAFSVQVSFYKWPFWGLGGSAARFSYLLGPGWDVPFQYKLLTTNCHFGAWAAQEPIIPLLKISFSIKTVVLLSK